MLTSATQTPNSAVGTHLQNKTDPCPRQRSMCWIILNSHVPDLLEYVDPMNDFVEHVSDDDGLSTPASVLPSRFDRSLLRSFGMSVQLCEDVELVRAVEIDV
jgi:hypothetical protein